MISMYIEMKCELCCDNDCLDLPPLTQINGDSEGIHKYMGYLILESMILFYFILFYFI